MKRLALVRHAKSSWKYQELTDYERPLNKRGLRDAPEMGRRLAERGFSADLLLSSPAQRALVTARHVAAAISYPLDRIVEEPDFYLASPDTLIARVQSVDTEQTETVMLFGHNPTFTFLANSLGDLSVDNLPTCGIAVFCFDLDHWSELDYGTGQLEFFDYPKNT